MLTLTEAMDEMLVLLPDAEMIGEPDRDGITEVWDLAHPTARVVWVDEEVGLPMQVTISTPDIFDTTRTIHDAEDVRETLEAAGLI